MNLNLTEQDRQFLRYFARGPDGERLRIMLTGLLNQQDVECRRLSDNDLYRAQGAGSLLCELLREIEAAKQSAQQPNFKKLAAGFESK